MLIADWLSNPPPCKIAKQWKWIWTKVKNYNLNVTEVLVSENAFPGIFNFTVGIL